MDLPAPMHDWDVSYEEARRVQEELRGRLEQRPLPQDIALVAGADMALSKEDDLFFATVVVLSYPEMETLERSTARAEATFPYIPGLLTFREAPVVLAALRGLERRPDAIIFDGQGIAHPRRMGLAAHMGLWLGMPTVGCAKSRLIGEYEEPGEHKGQWEPLRDEGEVIGSVLRTRTSVKPVFVSPGHLSDQEGARRLVLQCAVRYRLPEPTRRAHLAVGKAKRRFLQERT